MSDVTTLAVGEEGEGLGGAPPFDLPVFDLLFDFPPRGGGGGDITTLAIGEEGDGDVTTQAVGEEGPPGPGDDYFGF
jgi:hypothetical protein